MLAFRSAIWLKILLHSKRTKLSALRKANIIYNAGLSGCNRIKDPSALWKAKIVYNFGLSECNRFKGENITFGVHEWNKNWSYTEKVKFSVSFIL